MPTLKKIWVNAEEEEILLTEVDGTPLTKIVAIRYDMPHPDGFTASVDVAIAGEVYTFPLNSFLTQTIKDQILALKDFINTKTLEKVDKIITRTIV